ncbi:hemicentin-1-like [Stegodyphus dumicola]|uniref:hemicentin-1-like n=1 Tax=Stegodyphus dumicola TaxID=202533 RepID=UPI0015B07AE4|nr:hemicentin-1-like [Stegodyphus dumicola]
MCWSSPNVKSESSGVKEVVGMLLLMACAGAHHRHLRLEPPGHFHAFFTGDSFFVTCLAGERSGATRLTWQAPTGRDITISTGRVHVEASPHNPLGLELVFEDVRYEDRGKYSCSAIIDGKETKTHFILTVYLSISFWGTPEHQYGKAGNDFMLICNVRSDPSPIVSWYVNGTLVLEGMRHTITEDGLYIRDLKPSDAGNYTCRAFVVAPHSSQMKDRNIIVHVHYRPVWHSPHLERAHGIIGSSANLTCAAHSQPPPVFEWFRERALLGNSPIYKIINEKWKSILQIKIKDSSVFGNYQCVVSNIMGEAQRTISLIEGVVPNPPDVSIWSDEPGVLILKLMPSPDDVLPVLGYRIQWRLVTDNVWRQELEKIHYTQRGKLRKLQETNKYLRKEMRKLQNSTNVLIINNNEQCVESKNLRMTSVLANPHTEEKEKEIATDDKTESKLVIHSEQDDGVLVAEKQDTIVLAASPTLPKQSPNVEAEPLGK